MSDNVNHPSHYTFGEVECIDAIHSALGDAGFSAYCEGNAIKYLWRHRAKGGREDLEKAKWYIDRMIEARVDEMPEHLVSLARASAEVFKDSDEVAARGLRRAASIFGQRPKDEN